MVDVFRSVPVFLSYTRDGRRSLLDTCIRYLFLCKWELWSFSRTLSVPKRVPGPTGPGKGLPLLCARGVLGSLLHNSVSTHPTLKDVPLPHPRVSPFLSSSRPMSCHTSHGALRRVQNSEGSPVRLLRFGNTYEGFPRRLGGDSPTWTVSLASLRSPPWKT